MQELGEIAVKVDAERKCSILDGDEFRKSGGSVASTLSTHHMQLSFQTMN